MKPGDKNPYGFKLPEENSGFDKIIKPDGAVKKGEHYNTADKRDVKIPGASREDREDIEENNDLDFSDDDRQDNLLDDSLPVEEYQLLKKLQPRADKLRNEFVEAMNSYHPPGIWGQLVFMGKMAFYVSLMIPLSLIWLVHNIISLALPRSPKDWVRAIWSTIKFFAGLVVLAAIKVVELVFYLHKIYILLIILVVLLAVIFAFVINPMFSTTTKAKLNIKGPQDSTVYLTNNKTAMDVSFAELQSFLDRDDSDSVVGTHSGVVVSGAVRLHDTAEKAGIRAGVAEARLNSQKNPSFCWDVFNTTDYGTVYISAYHPTTKINGDSLIYIPITGSNAGMCYFIPTGDIQNPAYDQLSSSMGKASINVTITDINVIW